MLTVIALGFIHVCFMKKCLSKDYVSSHDESININMKLYVYLSNTYTHHKVIQRIKTVMKLIKN